MITFFDQKYKESNLRNNWDEVHPDIRPITNESLSANTPWCY